MSRCVLEWSLFVIPHSRFILELNQESLDTLAGERVPVWPAPCTRPELQGRGRAIQDRFVDFWKGLSKVVGEFGKAMVIKGETKSGLDTRPGPEELRLKGGEGSLNCVALGEIGRKGGAPSTNEVPRGCPRPIKGSIVVGRRSR